MVNDIGIQIGEGKRRTKTWSCNGIFSMFTILSQ